MPLRAVENSSQSTIGPVEVLKTFTFTGQHKDYVPKIVRVVLQHVEKEAPGLQAGCAARHTYRHSLLVMVNPAPEGMSHSAQAACLYHSFSRSSACARGPSATREQHAMHAEEEQA